MEVDELARILAGNDTSVLQIRRFLGLNENPDGDTVLKQGELAQMKNFRITRDNHLQIRPGTKTITSLSEAAVAVDDADGSGETAHLWGVWRGNAGGMDHILAAYGGRIWEVDPQTGAASDRGGLEQDETSFFGFGGKVYALNGHEYLCWDGSADTQFQPVDGYVPLVRTATTPQGDGTQLEPLNRLTNKRRVQFSPDGTAKTFQLPETDIDAVVQVLLNGEEVTGYTSAPAKGTVTLTSAPVAGVNTLEVTYTKGQDSRGEVTGMRYSELFNGSADTRVFLYGDGSHRAIYSGIPFDTGQAGADYFPALYEVAVGEANTPITALVRHYSRLMAYKTNSTWVIQYGSITLEDGNTTPAFYVQPVNRQLGNEVPGQVKLVENSPLTLDAGGVYQWRSADPHSGYISSNESNARRISDRVDLSLRELAADRLHTFNMKREHEFWFLSGGKALIMNYANDTWYRYEGLPFDHLVETDTQTLGFCDDGRVVGFSRAYRNDDGAAIDCYAATGAMDFDRDWLLKYSPMLFVAMQPEEGARLTVSVETNRRSDYPDKLLAYNLATYSHANYAHFSYRTNRKPQVERVKMKVKKATFYRLIFKSNSASATATVIQADVKLRYAGSVK